MYSSYEVAEYLARSPSRLRVLDALDEAARTRDELKELTDVSRYTLSRILADFEDREWIVRSGKQYELTGKGSVVATEFETMLANLEVAEDLGETLDWLQTEEFGFDLARLGDAEVYTPTQTDHTAHIRRAADALREADRVRSIATGVAHEMFEAIYESTVHGDLRLEGILDASSFDAVQGDPDLRQQVLAILDADGFDVFRYDGEDPLVMMILTGDALWLCGHDEDGPAPGTIRTEDPAVRSWAASYLDAVRADAHRIRPEAFAAR